MSENSPESTKSSTDTINVLPVLSEAKAPVSLTLTIDKSVGKIASWVLVLLLLLTFIAAFSLFVAWDARDSAIKTETELQLVDDWLQTHGVRKGADGKYHFKEEQVNGE